VTGVVRSPLATVTIADEFDLTVGRLSLGYLLPIGESLDVIAEVSYDSVNYDFGSIAGENFDIDESGAGGQIGLRWNPRRALELFAFVRHAPLGELDLSSRSLDATATVHTGLRWYFLQDLGLGIEYESGDVETFVLSLRFSYGNLPW
jgi:hypothetical protein